MLGKQNVIEVTLFAEGYFDFSTNNPDMFNAASEIMKSFKDSKPHYLPSTNHQMQYLRFLPTKKNYVVSFGRGVITISFLSKSPNDSFDQQTMKKHMSKLFSLINEKLDLKFSSFKIEKDSVFTELNPSIVDNACNGTIIPKRFGDYNDWELALHKRIHDSKSISDNSYLSLSKRIVSSTLLINGERVLSTYFTLITDPANKAARYNCLDTLSFFDMGLEIVNSEEESFNETWRNE